MKEVSIYIPCFNSSSTIGECLEAVINQRYPLKEIVVVDDGSSDDTARIVSRYPVRLIKHNTNKGLAQARNTAINNIRSEYVAAIDSDCLPYPDWLELIMRRFVSSDIAGVGGRLVDKYKDAICDAWRSTHMKQSWDKEENPVFLFGSNTVFRKSVLEEVGLYNEKYISNYEDVELCERIKKMGYSLVYEPRAAALHLKKDDMRSLLNNYWEWHKEYYVRKNYYLDNKEFSDKLKDNVGLANRYIEEDISSGNFRISYIDFLLAVHHSLKDFEYYARRSDNINYDYSSISAWLSLLDLDFFYHFDYGKDKISTLLPKNNIFMENFFALIVLLNNIILDKFRSLEFNKMLCKHLLLSLYNISDNYLLDSILALTASDIDWSRLYKADHPYLNKTFLETLFTVMYKWVDQLIFNIPDIADIIEKSAKEAESTYN